MLTAMIHRRDAEQIVKPVLNQVEHSHPGFSPKDFPKKIFSSSRR
jgi:hypothetical protein